MKVGISKREFEIVESVILYGSKKEAAEALNRSLYTVETTIKHVYEKKSINKISDLTLWFCGIKFGIADQVAAFKNAVLTIALVLVFSAEGINNDLFSVQRTFPATSTQSTGQTRIRRRRKEKAIIFIKTQNTIAHAA